MSLPKIFRGAKTVRKILLPTIVLSLSFLGSSCGEGNSTAGAGGGDEVAATVNGVKILYKDVDRVIAQQLGEQGGQISPVEQAAARIQALDSLITQDAQKENIVPSADEIKRFIHSTKVEKALTEEAFAKELQRTNQTEQKFRES